MIDHKLFNIYKLNYIFIYDMNYEIFNLIFMSVVKNIKTEHR